MKDYRKIFVTYLKVLTQENTTKEKSHNVHESQDVCIAKGKSEKKYDFEAKVATVRGLKIDIISSVKDSQAIKRWKHH